MIWYNFSGQNLALIFWHEKLDPNFLPQKIYHMNYEIFQTSRNASNIQSMASCKKCVATTNNVVYVHGIVLISIGKDCWLWKFLIPLLDNFSTQKLGSNYSCQILEPNNLIENYTVWNHILSQKLTHGALWVVSKSEHYNTRPSMYRDTSKAVIA